MRRFASDIFAARKIKFDFDTPTTVIDAPMGANLRRELYVIFKEAVNNIARHAAATRAEISLTVFDDSLVLKISDDGRGFDPNEKLGDSFAPDLGGNGLINLRRRGADLGGRCEVISFPGGGTTVLLEIPLRAEDITVQIGSESHERNELG
jgi:signal transduction histidine kinase